jgi:flagellar motor switch protein FliM
MDPAETLANNQEVLSQSDVERLLAQVAEQESTTTVLKTGGEKVNRALDTVQPYDFRQPAFLAAGELRKLRLRHEEFTRSLAARLSMYLRLEFGLQMAKLQTMTFKKFIDSLPNPTHITLFKVEPMRGISILDIPPQLGVTVVDRLLGGQAHSVTLERDLSEIEVALLDQVVQIILGEWCNQWLGLHDLRPALIGHESNGRFLQTASHDTVLLVLGMEVRLGDCQETMQLGFPYYTLEPLVRQLNAELETGANEPEKTSSNRPVWNAQLDQVRIPITAIWDGLELTARDIAGLQVGQVLQLDPQCLQQVQIRLAKLPKFQGRLGTQGSKWAVELTQVLKS